MAKWIKCSERLPELHDEVLLYMPTINDQYMESNYAIGYLESDGNFYFNNYQDSIGAASKEYITHWLELPEPPEEFND